MTFFAARLSPMLCLVPGGLPPRQLLLDGGPESGKRSAEVLEHPRRDAVVGLRQTEQQMLRSDDRVVVLDRRLLGE